MITCTTLLFAAAVDLCRLSLSRKKSGKAKIFTFSTNNIERPSQFSMFNGGSYREQSKDLKL